MAQLCSSAPYAVLPSSGDADSVTRHAEWMAVSEKERCENVGDNITGIDCLVRKLTLDPIHFPVSYCCEKDITNR